MEKYQINIFWSNEDESFVASVPELKYLMAHGDTQEEALHEAQEAIKLWLEVAKADGMVIPEPKGQLVYN